MHNQPDLLTSGARDPYTRSPAAIAAVSFDHHMPPLPGPSTDEIVVPGSISNLGPGFDALAVAIQLYLRVRVVEIRAEAPDTLECRFPAGDLAGENRILTAFTRARAALGTPTPGVTVEILSEIPARAGLGSSGAATIAGLRLYERIAGRRPPEGWLPLATRIEGHPDNAAAALLGGLVLACQHDDGDVSARALRWPDAVGLVVAIPATELPTPAARRALPPSVPLVDAVFNLQHALLLVEGLRSADPAAVGRAMRDRWHQPSRMPLVPGLRELLGLRHPALLGACLSGAGPSVLALTTADGALDVTALLTSVYEDLGIPCRVTPLAVHQPAPQPDRPRERIFT
jgi:homoserine kinase